MMEIFDVTTWRQVFVSSLTELGRTFGAFMPKLVGMLLLLAFGWVLSRGVEIATSRSLRRLGVDRLGARLRVSEALTRAGVSAAPSQIVARLVFWVLMLTFVLSGVEALGLRAVAITIDRLIVYLPSVIGAGLILILGLFVGRLVGNLVTSGAAAANLGNAPSLGTAANALIVLLVVVLALEELGIDTRILVTVTTALVTAVSLALGIAFALGARPVVGHILAGHFLRQNFGGGRAVEIRGRKGVVERVGAVDTLVRDGERAWSIPNSVLLDEIVNL